MVALLRSALARLGREAADDLGAAYAAYGGSELLGKASGQQPSGSQSPSTPPPVALTPAQQAALAAIMKRWDEAAWEKLADDVWRYTAPVARGGGRETLLTLGLGDDDAMFDTVNQTALDWAQDRAAEMVGMRRLVDGRLVKNPSARWAITDSTRNMLRGLVADNIHTGASVNELRRSITDSTAFAPARALNIAATELHLATQSGSLIAARASGLTLTKEVLLSDLHPAPDDCDDYAATGSVPLDYEYAPGITSPPFHPACACDMSYARPIDRAAASADLTRKTFDEAQVVRDEHGRFADQGGPKLRSTNERAFSGEPRPLRSRPSKQETGRLGEEIALSYMRDEMGIKDTQHLNIEHANAPIDLAGDHALVEVKAGLVSNSSAAQKWRMTIGEPGKAETDWMRSASAEERAAWNRDKAQRIVERKDEVLREQAERLGAPVTGYTVGILLDSDRRIADVHVFRGFHAVIRWNSAQTAAAYKGSYSY